jgi:hypothetical protein
VCDEFCMLCKRFYILLRLCCVGWVGGWVVLGGLLIESLEFKFVLKLMDDNEVPVIIEEGSNRC